MPNGGFEREQSDRRERAQDFRDPKKHFVRLNGWLPVVHAYAEVNRRRVNYLSLCGKEAIDVRYFAIKGVLERNNSRNHYPTLTFVESNAEDFAVIAESLGRVRLSIKGKIERVLLDAGHPQHPDLIESFPYHVLNLDFCGDIVPQNDHPYSDTLHCIRRVVELQALSDVGGWHLFLTFRAQRALANQAAIIQLAALLDGNLGDNDLRAAYGVRALPAELRDASYPEFLRIGIAKLLAHIATPHGFQCEVEASYVYGRHQGAYHIVKLILRFVRIRRTRDLPNPALEQGIYKNEVSTAFRSQAVDVDRSLAGVQDILAGDLQPVLDELDQMGIVRG